LPADVRTREFRGTNICPINVISQQCEPGIEIAPRSFPLLGEKQNFNRPVKRVYWSQLTDKREHQYLDYPDAFP
jgi:hypothetical protein